MPTEGYYYERLVADNVRNLYEIVSTTIDDFLSVKSTVDEKLIDLGFDKLVRKVNTIGVKLDELIDFDGGALVGCRVEYISIPNGIKVTDVYKAYGVSPKGLFKSFRFNAETIHGTLTPLGCITYIINVGKVIGLNKLLSIAKDVSGELYKAIYVVSNTKFRMIQHLSKNTFRGTFDCSVLKRILSSLIIGRGYVIAFIYIVKTNNVYKGIAVQVGNGVDIALCENINSHDVFKAFDVWLSIITYYNVLYYKLYNVVVLGKSY